jgi:subtilisin family serine protease
LSSGLSAIAAIKPLANDPFFAQKKQWAIDGNPNGMRAALEWCNSRGAGILVAVVGDGIDFNHPELVGKLIPGAAFIDGNGTYSGNSKGILQSKDSHGTEMAGIIAAKTDNGIGIAGVAPDAKILVVRVGRNNSFADPDIAAGIRFAADKGADVINLSLSLVQADSNSQIPAALDYAAAHNVAIAISAGNFGNENAPSYTNVQLEDITNHVLLVGALDSKSSIAKYSAVSPYIQVYSPGGDDTSDATGDGLVVSTSLSTIDNGYVYTNGTSIATAMVSGTLALLRGMGYSANQAREKIISGAILKNGIPHLDAVGAMGACQTSENSILQGIPVGTPIKPITTINRALSQRTIQTTYQTSAILVSKDQLLKVLLVIMLAALAILGIKVYHFQSQQIKIKRDMKNYLKERFSEEL